MVMLAPTALVNSAITGTTFTGSWTPPTGTPAAGYNVLISSNGGVNDTYLTSTVAPTFDFANMGPGVPLVPGATYTWSIQAYGGDPTEYSDLARQEVTLAGAEVPPPPPPPPPAVGGPEVLVRNSSSTGWERRKWQVRNADNTAWTWGA